jgi:Bacterial PH domain
MQAPSVLVFRSRTGGAMAVAWMVIALVLWVDVLIQGTGWSRLWWSLGLLGTVFVAYVLGVRPCVIESPSGLIVVNPLREATVPWSAVADIYQGDVAIVETTDVGKIRCFALPRTRKRPQRTAMNPFAPRLPQDLELSPAASTDPRLTFADVMRLHWEERTKVIGFEDSTVQWRWSVLGVGALVVGAGLVAVALLGAALR